MKGIPSLQSIELFNNRITGNIPSTINTLTNLGLLDLEGNMLTGELFSDEMMSIASNLKSLRVSFNMLEGSIPSSINNFTQLQEFWVARNQIKGKIPDEICQLKGLSELKSIAYSYINYIKLYFKSYHWIQILCISTRMTFQVICQSVLGTYRVWKKWIYHPILDLAVGSLIPLVTWLCSKGCIWVI